VIDRACRVERTLVVPDRFEIAGVGLDGSGSLIFNLPDNARAMRFSTAAGAAIRHSKIRDLSIGNLVCCGQTGIDLSNTSLVQLANLRISGFTRGIFGKVAYMTTINGSNLSNNGFGVVFGFDTTTWRIRDSASSFNYLGGVAFDATTRQSVISGGVFESNPWAGVDVSGFGNTIEGSWFEGNAVAILNRGLIIRSGTVATAVLTSTFSIDKISDGGTDTRRCFNFSPDLYNPNSCP
jgi:nitrous oxidase accessory protein NosD